MTIARLGLILALLPVAAPAAERFKPVQSFTDPDYLKDNRNPAVLAWSRPQYPAEPKAAWQREFVTVAVIIDEQGRPVDPVAQDGPGRFHAAALAAIREWRFTPATTRGEPTRKEMLVRFEFLREGPPRGRKPDWPPYALSWPKPVPAGDPPQTDAPYPPHLEERRLSGVVGLAASLDVSGRVDGVKIAHATHPDFLSAALATVASWRCTPARQGRVPQPGLKITELVFIPVDEKGRDVGGDWLERNGIVLRDHPGTKADDYFDKVATAVWLVDPVYPRDLALGGVNGSARVNFSVDLSGQVVNVAVQEATAPEFGEALAAAIAAWQFQPLQRNGEASGADFSITWRFNGLRPDSVEQRLRDDLLAGKPAGDARQLDRPLFPLFTRPPVRRNSPEAGEAAIEVTVDRDGRVRLPHIRSASRPELGWAAATAVSQWLFETPRKNGEPVEARVVISVKFAAPAGATPP